MARPRILFVDDDPAILRGIRNALRKDTASWDFTFMHDAREAIASFTTQEVDVVVSDARMADVDGAAVLEAAAATCPKAHRIVLTGQAEEHALTQLRVLAHEILLKPCSPDELRAAIRRAVG